MSILKDYLNGRYEPNKDYFADTSNKKANMPNKFNNNIKNRTFNQNCLTFSLEMYKIGTKLGKPQTPEDFAERIEFYFNRCEELGWSPNWEGIGVITNYSNQSLWEITEGIKNPQFTEILKEAKQYLASFDANAASAGVLPASVYQFRAKNFYGMRDIQDIRPVLPNSVDEEEAQNLLKRLPT